MMRISEWAKYFGVWVEPAKAEPGQKVYRVADIFTTRDGSWEPDSRPGSVPAWARADYLKPIHHPQYNDDGGADHHIFGSIRNDGNMQPFGDFHFWTHRDNQNHTTQRVKLHGWANVVMFSSSSYVVERNEKGPWAWAPNGVTADVVYGAGLPSNWHISFFAVWRAEVDPGDGNNGESTVNQRLDALQKRLDDLSDLLQQWTGD